MATLHLKTKPAFPRLNLACPVARGLIFAYEFHEGSSAKVSSSAGNPYTAVPTAPDASAIRKTAYGHAIVGDSGNFHGFAAGDLGQSIGANEGFSYEILGVVSNANAYKYLINGTGIDGAASFRVYSRYPYELRFGDNASQAIWDHGQNGNTDPVHLVIRGQSGSAELIVNGVSKGAQAAGTSGAFSNLNFLTQTAGTAGWPTPIVYIRAYRRKLDDADISQLLRDPWTMYRHAPLLKSGVVLATKDAVGCGVVPWRR